MENLAPPMELLMEVRFGLEKGQSLKKTILSYIEVDPKDPWRQELRLWLKLLELGRSPVEILGKMNMTRRQCLETLHQGLRGEPIYSQICNLEAEVYEAAKLEVEEFISLLPMKSLVPLLIFQFPALLMLLIGPFFLALMTH